MRSCWTTIIMNFRCSASVSVSITISMSRTISESGHCWRRFRSFSILHWWRSGWWRQPMAIGVVSWGVSTGNELISWISCSLIARVFYFSNEPITICREWARSWAVLVAAGILQQNYGIRRKDVFWKKVFEFLRKVWASEKLGNSQSFLLNVIARHSPGSYLPFALNFG